jgi:phospholipid/cholesterol/gamma-HCH transport system substrate-binding protein
MKKIFSKEAIIGLVTIASLFILYSGVNYLRGINILKPGNHYYVLMPNVSDLQISSPVYVDGFKVGIVNAIHFNFNDPNSDILVQISLDKNMRLQTGSYAELKSGLTSGAYLNLVLNHYVSSFYQVGDTIEGRSELGLMDRVSTELLPQIENILPRLDSILLGIQVLVNHPALSQSLDHIGIATSNLEKSSGQLNRLLANDVPQMVSNLNKISADFAVISNNLKELNLQKTLSSVDAVLLNMEQMSKQLNNPNSTMGLFLNDRSLYDHLDLTASNAAILLQDLKENPKRYVHFSVFGKK